MTTTKKQKPVVVELDQKTRKSMNIDQANASMRILPIDSEEDAFFDSIVGRNKGPLPVFHLQEIREKVAPYQDKLFAWLRKDKKNAQLFVKDPVKAVKQAELNMPKELLEEMKRVGEEVFK